MKKRPDLNELSKEIFQANKAKGFHDKETSNETFLMLVITELSEAVEADRKDKRADLERMNDEIIERNQQISDILNNRVLVRDVVFQEADNESELDTFKKYFEYRVKDTIEDELADAVIRLLGLAGLRGYDVSRVLLHSPSVNANRTFSENIFKITTDIVYYKYSMSERINFAIINIEELCKILSINLWLHVELKMKYNSLRPHKYGKNY